MSWLSPRSNARARNAPAFLDEACAGDDALRHEVESQIAYQQQASKFLEEPAFNYAAESIADPQTETESMEGRTIGHYRILRKLGAGGMGEVYLGGHRLKRKVALKLRLPSSLRISTDRRFEQEAQAASQSSAHNNHSRDRRSGSRPIHRDGAGAGRSTPWTDPARSTCWSAWAEIAALSATHAAGITHRSSLKTSCAKTVTPRYSTSVLRG